MTPGHKRCAKCKAVKPASAFHKYSKNNPTRLQGYCIPCFKLQYLQYELADRQKRCALRHEAYVRKGGHAALVARSRAVSAGKLDFAASMAAGNSFDTAAKHLNLGIVGFELCKLLHETQSVSLDEILSHLYGDTPEPGDRARAYNTLKRVIFTARQNLHGTGFSIANLGYRKGYALVRSTE